MSEVWIRGFGSASGSVPKFHVSATLFVFLRFKLVKSEGYARMEKNILAEIETFRGIEPEADIGEALRQLVKEVTRRSKQVRLK